MTPPDPQDAQPFSVIQFLEPIVPRRATRSFRMLERLLMRRGSGAASKMAFLALKPRCRFMKPFLISLQCDSAFIRAAALSTAINRRHRYRRLLVLARRFAGLDLTGKRYGAAAVTVVQAENLRTWHRPLAKVGSYTP